jgi:hypothetical protein
MKFKDSDDLIYKTFCREWWAHRDFSLSDGLEWHKFIELKDLGISCNAFAFLNKNYYIEDKQKWMLSKLKYGI